MGGIAQTQLRLSPIDRSSFERRFHQAVWFIRFFYLKAAMALQDQITLDGAESARLLKTDSALATWAKVCGAASDSFLLD